MGAARQPEAPRHAAAVHGFRHGSAGQRNRYPNESVDSVAFNPVGQVVGQFTKVEKSATVIERWVQEYLAATTRLDELNEAAAV